MTARVSATDCAEPVIRPVILSGNAHNQVVIAISIHIRVRVVGLVFLSLGMVLGLRSLLVILMVMGLMILLLVLLVRV